jgi:S-adenosylmethionine hydrolase
MKIITFISDFGTRDWFVAAVKGEILKVAPSVRIVDITHHISPSDVRGAAFVLSTVFSNFPVGTVHLAVVDPGVGGERKPLIVRSRGHYFVGPDNGLFSYVYGKDSEVYEIAIDAKPSATFHARDIFGPAAARLANDQASDVIGVSISTYEHFEFPGLIEKSCRIEGIVMYVDHFGNLITNVPNELRVAHFQVRDRRVTLKRYYSEGEIGEVFALRGSCGYYEITSNKCSASKILDAKVGMAITVEKQSLTD